MRVEAWFAICAAFSSVPPFFRYAVMPVARKLWLPSLVAMPRGGASVDHRLARTAASGPLHPFKPTHDPLAVVQVEARQRRG